MYKRVDNLKKLLNSTKAFESAIYKDGILTDIRFKFPFRGETFLLHYKFDYSKPRLYHIKKDKILTEVKDFIIPKTIKEEISLIQEKLDKFNSNYQPLVPDQKCTIGSVTFVSKFLNEYSGKEKNINFITATYHVYVQGEKTNEIELIFVKNKSIWETTETRFENELKRNAISMNVHLLEDKIVKLLNKLESEETLEDDLLKISQMFLEGTE